MIFGPPYRMTTARSRRGWRPVPFGSPRFDNLGASLATDTRRRSQPPQQRLTPAKSNHV
jgi:hypothetical protein